MVIVARICYPIKHIFKGSIIIFSIAILICKKIRRSNYADMGNKI